MTPALKWVFHLINHTICFKTNNFLSLQLSSEDGIAEFDIDIEELREELKRIGKWFPANLRLKVKSVVTEGATLNKETGIHDSVVFSNYPFKFSCRRSKRFFRPLRKYYLKVNDAQHYNYDQYSKILNTSCPPKGIDKQRRPKLDCLKRSCLLRAFSCLLF